jgi:RNA polymerase sigma-70 factor (ECF subfamily)
MHKADIEEYYKKYGPMVLRRCRWLLRDEEMALDAMQDVFVLMLRNMDRLTCAYPSSLLYRIATNVCLNIIRDGRKMPETRDEEVLCSIASAEDPYAGMLDKSALDGLFEGEKESTRVIAVLVYLDNMTLKETAKEVGLSVSGVRKRLRHLREKAKKLQEKLL